MSSYQRRPQHFSFGWNGRNEDSPCGLTSMWHRGVGYTHKPEQVTCGHCRRWLVKQSRVVLVVEAR